MSPATERLVSHVRKLGQDNQLDEGDVEVFIKNKSRAGWRSLCLHTGRMTPIASARQLEVELIAFCRCRESHP
jgi:hypothetical protein